jgi:L-alanine-DL-glutamate epimerase-like enolase superfamily enzyme
MDQAEMDELRALIVEALEARHRTFYDVIMLTEEGSRDVIAVNLQSSIGGVDGFLLTVEPA